jgi:hypothetical protein
LPSGWCPLKRDHFVLGVFPLLEPVDGSECRHFPFQCHPAQAVQFRHEGQTGGMIYQSIPTDPGTMQGEQVLVPTADDGDEIAGVLHFVGVTGGVAFDFVASVGDSDCLSAWWSFLR